MKKHLIILAVAVLALPVFAQETNEFRRPHGERPELDRGRKQGGRSDWSPERKEEMDARRLQLMEKALDEIGISEEQRIQIYELQKEHHENMKAVSQKASEARERLSWLQDHGATEAELDAAIDAVSKAQSEQLRILVRNRMEMERILGPEKNALFMEKARSQFRKHGRHGGSGIPPRPSRGIDDSGALPAPPPAMAPEDASSPTP